LDQHGQRGGLAIYRPGDPLLPGRVDAPLDPHAPRRARVGRLVEEVTDEPAAVRLPVERRVPEVHRFAHRVGKPPRRSNGVFDATGDNKWRLLYNLPRRAGKPASYTGRFRSTLTGLAMYAKVS